MTWIDTRGHVHLDVVRADGHHDDYDFNEGNNMSMADYEAARRAAHEELDRLLDPEVKVGTFARLRTTIYAARNLRSGYTQARETPND